MWDMITLTVSRSLLLIRHGDHGEDCARAENVGRSQVGRLDTSCEAGNRVEDG